jgi:hypothetical protein
MLAEAKQEWISSALCLGWIISGDAPLLAIPPLAGSEESERQGREFVFCVAHATAPAQQWLAALHRRISHIRRTSYRFSIFNLGLHAVLWRIAQQLWELCSAGAQWPRAQSSPGNWWRSFVSKLDSLGSLQDAQCQIRFLLQSWYFFHSTVV